MENVWKDGIARCTRLNRLKSIIFLWFSAHEKILHEKLFQETRSRWSVFFFCFSNDLENIEILEQKQRFAFFKLSVREFGKSSMEEKRKHDGKDVPKYVLGESNRKGEGWWKREPAGRKQRREKAREEARKRGENRGTVNIHADDGGAPISSIFSVFSIPQAFPLVPWNSWTATFLYFRTRLNHREGFPTASQWERIRSLSRTAHVALLLGLFRIRSIASLISLIELPENGIRKR